MDRPGIESILDRLQLDLKFIKEEDIILQAENIINKIDPDVKNKIISALKKADFSDLPDYQRRGINTGILEAIDIINSL